MRYIVIWKILTDEGIKQSISLEVNSIPNKAATFDTRKDAIDFAMEYFPKDSNKYIGFEAREADIFEATYSGLF